MFVFGVTIGVCHNSAPFDLLQVYRLVNVSGRNCERLIKEYGIIHPAVPIALRVTNDYMQAATGYWLLAIGYWLLAIGCFSHFRVLASSGLRKSSTVQPAIRSSS